MTQSLKYLLPPFWARRLPAHERDKYIWLRWKYRAQQQPEWLTHKMLAAGVWCLLAWLVLHERTDVAPGIKRAEGVTLALAIVGFAMSAAGAYLAYKKSKNVLKDDSPQTEVERGMFLPWVVGRRRVAPRVLWVEGSSVVSASPRDIPTGGKRQNNSGSGFTTRVWHGLCVGPASRIRRIWINGQLVQSGVITPEFSQSGTEIAIGKHKMVVFWGERDQRALTEPGFPFSSRFPFLCSAFWTHLDLGPYAQHPLIEYEVEVQPHGSQLKQSPAWSQNAISDPGSGANVPYIQTLTPGNPIAILNKNVALTFYSQQVVRLSGIQATGHYGKSPVYVDIGYSIYESSSGDTFVFLGAETTRTVQNQISQTGDFVALCTDADDDGANLAHALYHALFAPWPWGGAETPDEWDIDSFEALGVRCYYTENLRGDLLALNGETLEAIVGQTLQDLGIAISHNYDTGKLELIPIREPDSTRFSIPQALILPPRPEIETLHDRRPADQLVFSFSDRTQNYRTMTLVAMHDAGMLTTRQTRVREISITSTTHFATAVREAFRLTQQELANQSKFTIFAQRDARYLVPGRAGEAAGVPFVLRLISNQIDVLTAKTKLISLVDVYGVPLANDDSLLELTGDHLGSDDSDGTNFAVEDAAVGVFELPRMYEDEEIKIVVLRARANAHVTGAWIWLSLDDDSYVRVRFDDAAHAALRLTATLAASRLTSSVEADQVGIDVPAVIEDLTSLEESWRLGRQIAVCGDELMYLRSATALGGDSFRLDDLLRGRYATPPQQHNIGDVAFVTKSHELKPFASAFFQPGRTVYVKVQPTAADGGEVPIQSCAAHAITIQNKAWTPIAVFNLDAAAGNLTWTAGQAVRLHWRYFSTQWPKTGAGMQPAGAPAATSPVQGSFEVTLAAGDDAVAKLDTLEPALVLDQALVVSVYGAEPSTMTVTVRHCFAGKRSTPTTVLLTKV